MPGVLRRLPAIVAATVACGLSGLAGCAGQAPGAAAPSCRQPSESVLPNTSGSLDETSAGAYCLRVGEAVAVFLHGQSTARLRWAPISSSDQVVLAPKSTGVLTAPIGVTPGIFAGRTPGTAKLSSSQPGGATWSVTIVVS
jgi:hypothetical protein